MAEFLVNIVVREISGDWTRTRSLPEFSITADSECEALSVADNIVNPFQDWELGKGRSYELSVKQVSGPKIEPMPDWERELLSGYSCQSCYGYGCDAC